MDERKPIAPQSPRWRPNDNPDTIEVPGLDKTASIHDQIDQIEQLITIKLQNIDENMAKVHHALSSKILPAVKRYAVGTQPVREAAKFWTSFYEQAAQIRIPTYDDYSTVNEQSSRANVSEADTERPPEQSPAPSEASFAPSQAAFSSTPATHRVLQQSAIHSEGSEPSSWTASMESPLVRLDREIQSLSREDDSLISNDTILSETPSRSRSKGKGKDQALLRTILKQNLHSGDDPSAPTPSPLKPKGILKTPIPKHLNPYIAPDTDPAKWSGVVDLRVPSTSMTPQRGGRFAQLASRKKMETPVAPDDSDDSWEGDLPPGMSPPVLMSPARPPRSSAELGLLKLGQTPSKEAAARISKDLLNTIQKSAGRPFGYPHSTVESSMSTVPTPPSLSRYKNQNYDSTDPSFDSAISRVGLLQTGYPAYAEETITPQGFGTNRNDDEDDDSFSDEVNTMHPSAAFLLASGSRHSGDDSFDSSDSDDDGLVAFEDMREAFDDDDSFDNSVSYDDRQGPVQDTDTLFGLRANERRDSNELRLHNLNVFDDTTSMSAQLGRHVDSSPTPANWDRK